MVTFKIGNNDYINYLANIIDEVQRNYPSLAEVVRYNHREINRTDLLRERFSDWTPVGFNVLVQSAVEESKPEAPQSIGGSMVVMEDSKRSRRCVIILRAAPIDWDEQSQAAQRLAFLMHEVGHVDDYQKQINTEGVNRDTIPAEVYAHTFACRSLRERGFKAVLAYYLVHLILPSLQHGNADVRQAAKEFRQSPEYRESLNFALDEVSQLNLNRSRPTLLFV